ncbi:MAG: hypothetical protein QNJ54_08010 [Prochloraceae cyanobacterium]|nr:hypothetical protein [Prochloraceae cyanobacterium]
MNPYTLRQLWSLIEDTQTITLLDLSDIDLVVYLLTQMENRQPLSLQEVDLVSNYIHSKISLIRDLADVRS